MEETKKIPWKHPDKIFKNQRRNFRKRKIIGKYHGTFLGSREDWEVAPVVKCLENIREVSKVKCEIPGKQLGTILEV